MTEAASCRNVHMRHSENSPKLPDMEKKICERSVGFLPVYFIQGLARTQTPTLINCVPELPTFGVIAGVSPTEVQWKGLLLEEPPGWSRYPLYQVSMLQDWKAKLLPKLIFKYIWCFFIGESYDFSSSARSQTLYLSQCPGNNVQPVLFWALHPQPHNRF